VRAAGSGAGAGAGSGAGPGVGAGEPAAPGLPFERVQFYKVSFTEVPELVGRRHVFVHQGFAFVPETDLVSVLQSRFRAHLSLKLAVAFRSLPYVRQEERIRPILKMLETAYVGPDYASAQSGAAHGQEVRADNLDSFAVNMPLCMRECHGALKRKHHIKYHARRQLQLFFKGIGLSMNECLRYFQAEMAKGGRGPDQFNKEYAYAIRHNYGQEGKRTNYTPLPCAAIIAMAQPANADEHHGCPFRGYQPATLRQAVARTLPQGPVAKTQVDEIMQLVEGHHYQLACRRHFELQHPGAPVDEVGNHPNAWFEHSAKWHAAQAKPAAPDANAPPPAQPAQTQLSQTQASQPMEM
jgi:DNA primase large subunit